MPYSNRNRPLPGFALKKSVRTMSGVLLATLGAAAVQGQQEQEGDKLEEVVVTGTLIRGTEVTGSQTIGISTQDILELGAVTTNEILATVPQVTNYFNSRPEGNPRGSDSITMSRPNLRNMPGFNSASGSVTLLLMDGHRIAPVGVNEAAIDADVFLNNTIRSVDIVTDGGSALYGADAVAGVINFVTKDEFDGVQIDLDYGAADDYDSTSVNLIGGTSWDGGSIYAAFIHTDRDELLNGDRDWAKTGFYDDDTGEFTPEVATTCLDPVRTVYGWFNYGAGWTNNPRAPGAGPKSAGDPGCDQFSQAQLLPEQQRDGAFLAYKQDINESINFGVKAYYSDRTNTYNAYPLGSVAPAPFDVANTSPADLDQETIDQFGLPDPGDFGTGSVYDYPNGAGFSYGAHPDYRGRDQEIEMSTWGIAPELTVAMAGDWQLRATLYYGESENSNLRPETNEVAMAGYVTSGQLNPLDIASADASVINDILDWESENETEHELFLTRAVADGPVFELPAGALRMAVGLEWYEDSVRTRSNTGPNGSLSSIGYKKASRDNTAAFMELAVPVLDTLDLSLQVRYDDYSDFGDTSNPQIGFNFTPAEWISIYGHWGEAFNAPTALDTLAISNGRFAVGSLASVAGEETDVYGEYDDEGLIIPILEGAAANLEPQTAEIWALGFDLFPLDGLKISANYYDIDFVNILGQLAVPDPTVRLNNPDKFIWTVTTGEWAAILNQIQNPEVFDGVVDPANPNQDIAYIYDRVTTNFSEAQMNGVDFVVSYTHDTNIGSMTYGVSGNYQTEFDLNQGGTVVDQLEFNSDLGVQGIVGWTRDNLRAKVTLKYSDGFNADSANMQGSVDSFLVTDLFLGYDFKGSGGIADGLSLRFNVGNLFDEDPPEYRRPASNVAYSHYTLGRTYKIGLTYTFF
ncbi:MAG: TonB-dependent receptor [Halieaceae bacterium]|nr:TonB-dependent receptor [Halieaceae bacterium]